MKPETFDSFNKDHEAHMRDMSLHDAGEEYREQIEEEAQKLKDDAIVRLVSLRRKGKRRWWAIVVFNGQITDLYPADPCESIADMATLAEEHIDQMVADYVENIMKNYQP